MSCNGLLLTQRGLPSRQQVEVVAHDAQRGTQLAQVDARADARGYLSVRLAMHLRDVEQIVVEVEKPGSESVEYGEAAADLPTPCSASARDLPRFTSNTLPPPSVAPLPSSTAAAATAASHGSGPAPALVVGGFALGGLAVLALLLRQHWVNGS